ncbi:MAG: UDP-N-acetylmuramoyl-L-alanyl-D-glutamate--2,6-diaminopimelate ligase [Candidatus Omnitrophica bacterium]|nr:UDP-N-acetylmuramoyl-L-alanyl-D-glutamate--2,6-diaminopimelate ligase [Candidatus Omnitrophota bacterium]
MKSIDKLFHGLKHKLINCSGDTIIEGISSDTRTLKRGSLFLALRGERVDGHACIKDALIKGTLVVCCEKIPPESTGRPFVLVDDTRKIMPILASRFFDDPSKDMRVAGITGTNGKTTVSYLTYDIFKTANRSPSLIGSVEYRIGDRIIKSHHTTPDAIELQELFKDMLGEGSRYSVMEVSSHALIQQRVEAVDFDVAVLTNVTGDHLDYHKTMKDYVDSKMMLFKSLDKEKTAILNHDDKYYKAFKKITKAKIFTYGISDDAHFNARDIDLRADGSTFSVDSPDGTFRVATSLIGLHNIYNILAAIAVAFSERVDIKICVGAINDFKNVPGRLESVDAGQRFKVFIDYAHTHDALENSLSVLKKFCMGEMVAVFGCGGDRDKTKRPKMGSISVKYADRVILTNDNPRSEDPEAIFRDIEKGIPRGCKSVMKIPDRHEAIKNALLGRGSRDIVLIAGKGHEEEQIIGDKIIPFNDKRSVLEILNSIK